MSLEQKIIGYLETRNSPTRCRGEVLDMLWGYIDDPYVWVIGEVDDFLIPYLERAEGKLEALSSPMQLVRERAKYLLEDKEAYELTLALHWIRSMY